MDDDDRPFRVLPRLDEGNRPFWTSGERGELVFWRCRSCRHWIHPPAPICPLCLSTDLAPEASSGRGVVHTYTVNHQPWIPGLDPPYVVAIVELDDQPGLRVTTNIVDCTTDEVAIGDRVEVTFHDYEDTWLPMFRRVTGDGASGGEGAAGSQVTGSGATGSGAAGSQVTGSGTTGSGASSSGVSGPGASGR